MIGPHPYQSPLIAGRRIEALREQPERLETKLRVAGELSERASQALLKAMMNTLMILG